MNHRHEVRKMPRKQKINLEKVKAALNTICPKRGCSIAPSRIRRIDFDQLECPEGRLGGRENLVQRKDKATLWTRPAFSHRAGTSQRTILWHLEKAVAAYQESLAADPIFTEARHGLARALQDLER
jgi:hypothetical protein